MLFERLSQPPALMRVESFRRGVAQVVNEHGEGGDLLVAPLPAPQ